MKISIIALILVAASMESLAREYDSHDRGSLSTGIGSVPECVRAANASAAWQDARSGCSTAVRVLESFLTLAVDVSEGEVRDYRTGRTGPGCRVEMKGSAAAYRKSGQPDVALREKFAELGWTEDFAYGADGPDGSAFAFRNGPALCVFRAHWDGGDDSDPTYVPEDRYDIEVDCLLSE
jgi:hypothetical protein